MNSEDSSAYTESLQIEFMRTDCVTILVWGGDAPRARVCSRSR